jgi:hypothetical protein
MKALIWGLLMLNLIVVAVCIAGEELPLKPLDKITGPKTEKEACDALITRVVEAKLFPEIRKECFSCDLEGNDGRTFQITLRFNKGKCGGHSPSTLLDRFLVCQRSPVILWYDSSQDRYLPWEYAFTYRKAK